MSKKFKAIYNGICTLVLVLVFLVALLLAGPRLLGMKVFTVLSGSMEPVYHTGSLIYVKDVEDKKAVPDGTVITFMADEEKVVTHRVVAAVPDEDDPSIIRYRTKGDANDMEDGTLVHYKNIIGTPVFTIPKLGYFANYIQQPPGSYLMLSFGAIFVMMLFLPELLAVFLEEEEQEEKPRREKKSRRREKSRKEKAPAYYEDYPERPARRRAYEDDEDYGDCRSRRNYDDYEEAAAPRQSERTKARGETVRGRHVSDSRTASKSRRRGGAHCAK